MRGQKILGKGCKKGRQSIILRILEIQDELPEDNIRFFAKTLPETKSKTVKQGSVSLRVVAYTVMCFAPDAPGCFHINRFILYRCKIGLWSLSIYNSVTPWVHDLKLPYSPESLPVFQCIVLVFTKSYTVNNTKTKR